MLSFAMAFSTTRANELLNLTIGTEWNSIWVAFSVVKCRSTATPAQFGKQGDKSAPTLRSVRLDALQSIPVTDGMACQRDLPGRSLGGDADQELADVAESFAQGNSSVDYADLDECLVAGSRMGRPFL